MAAFAMWLWNGISRVLDGSIFVTKEPAPPPIDPDNNPYSQAHLQTYQAGYHPSYAEQYKHPSASNPPPYAEVSPTAEEQTLAAQLRGITSPALLFVHLSNVTITDERQILDIVRAYCQNPDASKFEPHDLVDLVLKFHLTDPAKVAVVCAATSTQWLEEPVDVTVCKALLATMETDVTRLDMLRVLSPAMAPLNQQNKESILFAFQPGSARSNTLGILHGANLLS